MYVSKWHKVKYSDAMSTKVFMKEKEHFNYFSLNINKNTYVLQFLVGTRD